MAVADCSFPLSRLVAPLLAVSVLLAGCATLPAPPAAEETRAPDVQASPLPAQGARAYDVVPGESELRVLVYRAGELATFGHNHVIRTGDVRGTVYRGDSAASSGFELTIPVKGFEVDPADARAEEGERFDSHVSEGAARGTRDNMLGDKVLDADEYPEIRVRSVSLTGPVWNPDARMRVTLHGVSRDVTAPVAVTEAKGGLVIVTAFALRQSDFGITPFSALNGGLQVQDVIRLRVRIIARPSD